MKLTAILLLAACLQVAARTDGQTVTLKVTNTPMKEVFREIQKQTGLDILVDEALLEKTGAVTLDVKDMLVSEVLNICLKNEPLSYIIVDGRIVVKSKPAVELLPADNSPGDLPPGEIHGRITTKEGVPLVGANVIINRTKKGTQTDAKGEFTLKDVYPDDVLSVSYIGYKTQAFTVGGGKEFPLVLEVATNELDKVVIQAYGQTTKRYNTGNITTVTVEQIERQPEMNPLAALVGQVPGMVVTQTNGYASAPFKIEIEGRSVINAALPSEPLYIIDGVPLTTISLSGANYGSGSLGVLQNGVNGPATGQSPFFSLNPSDIESITVLKDADATAIYGSRGANGVIVVTTKKGKAGKTKVDVNFYQGVNKVTGRYDLLNTQQYVAMRQEAFKNDGIAPDAGNAYDLLTWNTNNYKDWQKYLWGRTGQTTDVQLSLSGGDKQNTFRIGGGYHRETSILSRSGADQRSSFQFNYNHKSLDQKLKISLITLFSNTQSNLIYLGGDGLTPPNAPPIFDSSGKLNFEGWAPVPEQLDPYGHLLQSYTSKTGFLNSHLDIDYEIFKGLDFSTQLGYQTSHNSQVINDPIVSLNPSEATTGDATFGYNDGTNAIIEPHLAYNGLIGKGKLSALLGGSYQLVSVYGNAIYGSGYVNDNLLQSISNAPIKSATDAAGQYKYESAFARINYIWDDEYVFNLSGRRDGSSRFGASKQFGNFGAVGAAWIFTQETWIKDNLAFLSFGKLRGSYGITGSDQIGDYGYLTRWTGAILSYQNTAAYAPIQHANPNLEWQANKKLEVAMDLGFLHDRFTIEASLYRNLCGNQLVSQALPVITGFNTVPENLAATIQNKGIAITLNAKLIDKEEFKLSVNFMLGANQNKLIAFPGLANSPYANSLIIGQPLNITRLLHYTSVDPLTGQYTFQDKNHDGTIDPYASDPQNDLYIKDMSVKYDGSFGTDLAFKGFQLNAFFYFVKRTLPIAIFNSTPGEIGNQSVQVFANAWHRPGDIAQYARFTTQPTTSDSYFPNSDGSYSDGSYIRLRNLSISYNLPDNWLKKIKMEGIKIYARGENLFVITKYNGIDPETQFGAMPPAKIVTAGIQFKL